MPPPGPDLDLVVETFVVAPASALLFLCDERTWARWFRDLRLTCTQDRGILGKRWSMSGDLAGTAEVWLEETRDGVIVHIYLRSRRPGQRPSRYGRPLRQHMFGVKDSLEAGRRPGEPGIPARASSLRRETGEEHGRCGDA